MMAKGHKLGKFKSSGILVSTGTGSSGWLYGAKRMTSYNVRDIITLLKEKALNDPKQLKNIIELTEGLYLEDEIANQISCETHF